MYQQLSKAVVFGRYCLLSFLYFVLERLERNLLWKPRQTKLIFSLLITWKCLPFHKTTQLNYSNVNQVKGNTADYFCSAVLALTIVPRNLLGSWAMFSLPTYVLLLFFILFFFLFLFHIGIRFVQWMWIAPLQLFIIYIIFKSFLIFMYYVQ